MTNRLDPRRLAGADRATQEAFLIEAALADASAAFVLDKALSLGLPDPMLFSGAIYQNVWNALYGLPPGHGVNDYDLGYFDPDTSFEAEDAWIRRCEPVFRDLPREVEVRNQARVHIWFSRKYGVDRRPLTSTADAVSQFAANAHAVGLTKRAEGGYALCAPYGIEEIFELLVRVRPPLSAAEAFLAKFERQKAIWPDIRLQGAPAG